VFVSKSNNRCPSSTENSWKQHLATIFGPEVLVWVGEIHSYFRGRSLKDWGYFENLGSHETIIIKYILKVIERHLSGIGYRQFTVIYEHGYIPPDWKRVGEFHVYMTSQETLRFVDKLVFFIIIFIFALKLCAIVSFDIVIMAYKNSQPCNVDHTLDI
jgi:hypothetical protein